MNRRDAKFERVTRSDAPLYGPRKLLLCGFSADAQEKFTRVLEMAGLAEVDSVWADESRAEDTMAGLMQLPDGTGRGTSSGLPRAIIVAGITEKQLHTLMTVCRKTGMQQSLWAVLTPISETWTLAALLAELASERRAMQRRKK
jgi:hypothetical protein